MAIQYFVLVKELLQAVAYPTAIIFTLYLFRHQLRQLLTRSKGVNVLGVQLDLAAGEQSERRQNLGHAEMTSLPANSASMRLPGPDSIYSALDDEFKRALIDQGYNENEKLGWAIRMRSVAETERRHELAYRIIFGSQIAALKQLNLPQQQSLDTLKPFYNAAASNPEWHNIYNDFSFEQWVTFLFTAGFATADIARPSLVSITDLGRHFLAWLVQRQLAEQKPG